MGYFKSLSSRFSFSLFVLLGKYRSMTTGYSFYFAYFSHYFFLFFYSAHFKIDVDIYLKIFGCILVLYTHQI